MAREFRQRERNTLAFVEIAKFKVLEIADEQVAGAVPFGECIEVIARLLEGRHQIPSGALLFDD